MLTPEQEKIVYKLVTPLKESNLLNKVMFIGSASEHFYEKGSLLPKSYRFSAVTSDIDLCVKNVYAVQKPTDFSRTLEVYGFEREVDSLTQKQRRLVLEFLERHEGMIYGINAARPVRFVLHNKDVCSADMTAKKIAVPDAGSQSSPGWEIPDDWDR